MNILDTILNAQNGAAVKQLGTRFGLGEDQAASALAALAPALAAGFQRNLQQQGGLESLIGALAGGQHERYIENPATLTDASTVADGNGILGHVFGSKDVSRQVASRAAAQTGLSSDLMKQMLPIVAAMMMGAFAKNRGGSPMAGAGATTGGGILDMLNPLLDRNRDGSMMDDVAGMIGQYLRRS
jgi:hypothetical protein